MNILQLCQWDFAGCGYLLSEAINTHTEHHSRHIRIESSRIQYPYDVLDPTSQQIQVLCNWADVFHIHDAFVKLPKRYEGKPTVITYHGSRYRKAPEKHHIKLRRNNWLGTVATPDLTVHGLQWLPDCRPDMTHHINRSVTRTRIAHSPTKRKTKGTASIINALLGKYDLDIIEGVTWDKCLKQRGTAHISIDQFRAGYGCSAIESWAMAQPVIAGGTPQVLAAINKCVGYIPFYACAENATEIRESVHDLLENEETFKLTVDAGRNCWKEFHSPKAVSELAIALYHQVQAGFINLKCQALNAEKTAIVRYLGIPTQAQTFFATVTGTHYRYNGNERDLLIDQKDLPQFISAKRGTKRLFKVVRRD